MTGRASPAIGWPEVAHGEPDLGVGSARVHRAVDPRLVLGPAVLEAVRVVVRAEMQERHANESASLASPWMTPPKANRVTGVPVKTIRAWVRSGRLPKRLKNRVADAKQQKYLVNVDDVVAVAEQAGDEPAETSQTIELRQRAEDRAQEVLAARAAKGR